MNPPHGFSENCMVCGGGIDDDHLNTCLACRYEQQTGRQYEADVDRARKLGMTLRDFHFARLRGEVAA